MTDFAAFLEEEHDVKITEAKRRLSTFLANTELDFEASDGILFVYDQLQKADKALEKVYEFYDRAWHSSKRAKTQNKKLRERLTKVKPIITKEKDLRKKERDVRKNGNKTLRRTKGHRRIIPSDVK
jgi:hypothetical protein